MWPHCNQRKSELSFSLAICNSCYPCEITAHVLTASCHRRRHREKSIRKAGKTRATSSIRIRRNRRNKKIRHEKRNRLNCVQNACTRCVASQTKGKGKRARQRRRLRGGQHAAIKYLSPCLGFRGVNGGRASIDTTNFAYASEEVFNIILSD